MIRYESNILGKAQLFTGKHGIGEQLLIYTASKLLWNQGCTFVFSVDITGTVSVNQMFIQWHLVLLSHDCLDDKDI